MSKRECIKSWGEYLILHLNRADGWSNRKIKTRIPLPSKIDLSYYIPDGQPATNGQEKVEKVVPAKTTYGPIAFIEHDGEWLNAGHYTVVRKIGSQWFDCNDCKILKRDLRQIKETAASVIILKRC
ncbi:MAG: hypothetical protein Q9166_006474 [cf. Caloplaca sp. 2 TL-2023]